MHGRSRHLITAARFAFAAAFGCSSMMCGTPAMAVGMPGFLRPAISTPAPAATSPSAVPNAAPAPAPTPPPPAPTPTPAPTPSPTATPGVSLSVLDISEVLGNTSGGIKQSAAYDGMTVVALGANIGSGATFLASGLQYRGSNLSVTNLGTYQMASPIQGEPTTRLFELWYHQASFLGNDQLTFQIGQIAIDQFEPGGPPAPTAPLPDSFMESMYGGLFVNLAFVWPVLAPNDMPSVGPVTPLAALGARLRWEVPLRRLPSTSHVTLVTGVFNGSPAPASGDPIQQNPSGTSFPLNGGILAISELRSSHGDDQLPYGSVYRLGAWYDSEQFPDLAFDNQGIPLASPLSSHTPQMYQGNYAVYAIADHWIAHKQGTADGTVAAFVQSMWTPFGDRNNIKFDVNGGLTYQPDARNVLGIGVGYVGVSSGAMTADGFTRQYQNPQQQIRSGETVAELTYANQVARWFQIQPTLQYVINPGAGGAGLRNELVLGVRTVINFSF